MSAESICRVSDKKVEKAVCDYWITRARDEENGSACMLRIDQPWDDVFCIARVFIVRDIVVADGGARCWKVNPRYSRRKARGCYPQLKPSLTRLEVAPSDVEALLRSKGASDNIVRRALSA